MVIFGVVVFVRSRRAASPATRQAFMLVGVMLLAQMALGIATVLQAAQLHTAITHQVGAMLSWVLILNARFHARNNFV